MCETIALKEHPFVMCNFAPPDMVGHTGKYEPCIIACEATGIYVLLLYVLYIMEHLCLKHLSISGFFQSQQSNQHYI